MNIRRVLTAALFAMLAIAAAAEAGPLRRLFARRHACPAPEQAPLLSAMHKPELVEAAIAFRSDLDPKSFAGALQHQLTKKGKLSFEEKRLARVLAGADSPRRDRQVARMEGHARVHLGLAPTGAVDWSAIDWPTILRQLLELLIRLLPLLI